MRKRGGEDDEDGDQELEEEEWEGGFYEFDLITFKRRNCNGPRVYIQLPLIK